jgi:hypothetical protein
MVSNIEISALVSLVKDLDIEMLTSEEWNRLCKVDPDHEGQMESMLQEFIVPVFKLLDQKSQQLIEKGLHGALSSPSFDYECILERVELPFEPIDNPRVFFLLLWRVIFESKSKGSLSLI